MSMYGSEGILWSIIQKKQKCFREWRFFTRFCVFFRFMDISFLSLQLPAIMLYKNKFRDFEFINFFILIYIFKKLPSRSICKQ